MGHKNKSVNSNGYLIGDRTGKSGELMACLSRALDFFEEAVAIVGSSHDCIYLNRAFTELTQFDLNLLNRAGGLRNLYADPEFAEKVFDYVSEDRTWYGEIELLSRDGRSLFVKARAGAVKDEEGRRIAVVVTHNAVSKDHRVEKALVESERRLSTLLGNLRGMAYRCANDEAWTMEFVSQGCFELTGYTRDDLIGNRKVCYNHLIHPNDQELVRESIQEALAENRPFRVTYRIITASGEEKWVWEQGIGVFSGEDDTHVLEGFITDITESRKSEMTLKEREASMRSIVAAVPVGIGLTKGKVLTWVSPELLNMVGYSEHELIGQKSRIFYETEEEYERVGVEKDAEIANKGTGEIDTRWKCKDGSIIDVHLRSTPVDPEDLSKGVTFTALDITFQRRLESQLQQAQKMEAIGTLAGGIAHDFNNILGAIMGYAEMALFDASEEHKVKYCVDQVLKASSRAKDLVKQILAFSRQSDHEKRPLQITPIVKETLKMLRAFIPVTIEIRHRLESDAAIVEADPTHIHQVLMNLCTNAQHAMRDRGGILEIALSAVNLRPEHVAGHSELRPGAYLKISVSDTGEGMDPVTMDRIFDPYFTTKKKGVGTGMGLAVVHGIVKEHRGTITVQSELGRGTTFDVFFPIAEKPIQAAGDEFSPLPGGSELILLVDDEEPLVRLIKGMLERLGYRVSARSSSLEALEAFRAHPDRFDLVITDMTMPNMTGDILAQKLMAVRPSIPVVLCTGYSELITDAKVNSLGIRELIMKPVLIREMAFTIRRILDGK